MPEVSPRVSPTIANTPSRSRTLMPRTSPRRISSANSSFNSRTTADALSACRTKLRFCSGDEAFVRNASVDRRSSTPSARPATLGPPGLPEPSTVTVHTLRVYAMLFTLPPASSGSAVMIVPSKSGLKLLRTRTGKQPSSAGSTVRGWMTFAPKKESSRASAYDRCGRGCATGTTFGSAVSTPSVSL